jgi:Lrp/AsnC family leucine-responsive transcriptional regulator
MKKNLQRIGFDELDRSILESLQTNGRISNADLARKIHLSQPAVHNRIKRLERRGVIRQYVAILDREVVGYDLMCLVYLYLDEDTPPNWDEFEAMIQAADEILECYRTTGEYDIAMKVVVQSREQLDRFIRDKLVALPFISRVKTNIIIGDIKETTALALK